MAPSIPMLTDADLADVSAAFAVATCREAILAAHRGDLVAPPRVHADLGDGRFAYTAGRVPGRFYGYRSYDNRATSDDEQLVVVQDDSTGRIIGMAVGVDLGRIRTGAIGGVAADTMAAPDASRMSVIGTGAQAWRQLWTIRSVRPLRHVAVFSRDPKRRSDFAERASQHHGIEVVAVDSAEVAVAGADIVVLATSSPTPVVDPAAIPPTAFVTTLGPKQVGRAEFDAHLAVDRAPITTDSMAQLHAYDPPFVLAGTSHADRVVSLGAVLAGDVTARPGGLFCSVGLAGTEVFLLAALLDR